jgi:CRP-like cAMP-binding protein
MARQRSGELKPAAPAPSSRAPRSFESGFPVGNGLLTILPGDLLDRLAPHLQLIQLKRQEVLCRAHHPLREVYFPITAIVSLVSELESGEMLEVGLIGRDGVVGTAVVPGVTAMTCDAIVQVPGSALRMSADLVRREVQADGSLHTVIDRYNQLLLTRCMRMSVCNMFHAVEQRCVRWLLTVNGLNGNKDIPMTHETLAVMLGVHRPTVTMVLGSLRRAGLILEQRGRMIIRDRAAMEAAACECYAIMRDEQHQLLGY